MHRRQFLKTAAAAGALPLLAGLPGRAFAADPKIITMWYEQATPDQKKWLQEFLADAFSAKYPDYKLEIDYRGSDKDKLLRLALLSGTGPDVVITQGPAYVGDFADASALLPLDDYAATFGWKDRIIPLFYKIGFLHNKLYSLPKSFESTALFYNQTLWKEKGWTPPTTIDELEAIADDMLAQKITPFGIGNADWRGANEQSSSIAFNSLVGTDAFFKAIRGEIPFTAEPFVAGFERLKTWWQKGYYGPNYLSLTMEQGFAQIATGKAGMAAGGTWDFSFLHPYFDEGNPTNAELGVSLVPSVSGPPICALGISSTFSINAHSQNPDGAAKALDYLFSPDFLGAINTVWQGEWALPLMNVDVAKLAPTAPPIYTNSMTKILAALGQGHFGFCTWAILPPATDAWHIPALEELWLDKLSVKDFLATFDEMFQRERAEGKVFSLDAALGQ